MPAGFAAIGGVVLGGLGVSAVAGGIATIVTGIAVSAVVGAAIGGISAAVMGGDIGKGMLFGAVGGVVTGGLAGGMIADTLGGASGISGISGGTGAVPVGSQSLSAAGSLGGEGLVYGTQATTAMSQATPIVGEATKTSLFGGALNTAGQQAATQAGGGLLTSMFKGTGGDLIKGAGALFAEDPYYQSKEYFEAQRAHDLAKIEAAGKYSGGGGGGGGSDVPHLELERLRQQGALNQIAAEAAESRKGLQLQGEQALTQQEQEYKLAGEQSAAEWQRALDKLYGGAQAAGQQSYQSGEGAYEAVLAGQQERQDPGSGRQALAGPEEMTA